MNSIQHDDFDSKQEDKALKVFFLAVAVTLIIFVFQSLINVSSSTDEGKETVSLAFWGNKHEIEFVGNLVEQFEQQHPEYEVKLFHIHEDNYTQIIFTMASAGYCPDAIYIQPRLLHPFLKKGLLADLTPFFEESTEYNLEDFYSQTLTPYRWDGEQFGKGPLYGICKDWSPDYLIFYNKDLFDEAGIPYPDGSWNREEFLEIAKKLTRVDNKGRTIQYGLNNNASIFQWIEESGASVFSEDGKQILLNDSKVVDTLRFVRDLSTHHQVSPDINEQQLQEPSVMFESQRAAMCFYGQWYVPQLRNVSFRWGVTTPPQDAKKIYLAYGMTGYAMSEYANNKKGAWQLIQYLVGPKGQKMTAEKGWNIPSNRTVALGPAFQENPDLPSDVIQTFLEAAADTRIIQYSPAMSMTKFHFYFDPVWEDVLLGEPLEANMNKLNKKLQKMLDRENTP